jgi:hypothetical protein
MTLKSGCNAVDAGTILPNINDDFVGAAPDLGAYEYGQPLPIYGPRPGNTDPPPPPAPALNVYRAGTLITMDGNLDEWSGADSATFSGTSSTATASLLWDDTNLYVAFQVTDTQLNAIATVRDDSNLWRDDAIEVYLDTKNDRATTMQADDYQFLVNLNNVQADLRGTGGGKDPTWNASWQSAVRLQGTLNSNGDSDGGYTLELVIPWAQIGVTPMTGMSFGLELVVDNSNPASATFEHFDWAGITSTGGPYAQPHLWNQVQLVDALPGVIDVTAPESSGVTVSSITSSGATISWTTNEPSDTQVDYGRTIAYGSVTPLNSELVTAHNRTLSGLAAGTLYHYRVKSRDAAGNLATSGDFTFRTHKRNR